MIEEGSVEANYDEETFLALIKDFHKEFSEFFHRTLIN